jgi:hypothetical protein
VYLTMLEMFRRRQRNAREDYAPSSGAHRCVRSLGPDARTTL